ncbi:MAG: HU family DNA-binding protein [Puniceicoccales bacterium]|jgi:DNA-binding protein HU-beta/integration host factor subunit alpha|nr:HU family DNA-binding protein [Puniceicoccales bacterium]
MAGQTFLTMSTPKKLTKKDIVQRLHAKSELLYRDVADLVQGVLDSIGDALKSGKTVELRNFGVFEVQMRKARVGRNPNRPEKTIKIPAQKVIKFRAGKELRLHVKGNR